MILTRLENPDSKDKRSIGLIASGKFRGDAGLPEDRIDSMRDTYTFAGRREAPLDQIPGGGAGRQDDAIGAPQCAARQDSIRKNPVSRMQRREEEGGQILQGRDLLY